MTYRQLAQLAGVSVSTVSKALSGNKEISVETIERIHRLAIENGIKRPRYYRAARMTSIAIVAPDSTSRFTSQTIDYVSRMLWANNIIPKVYLCEEDLPRYCNAIETIGNDDCIGIISLYDKRVFPHNIDLPILHISYNKMISGAFSAENDNSGVAQAVKHLVSLGHTEIGYAGINSSAYEEENFKKILERYKLDPKPEYVYRPKEQRLKSADEATKYYLSLPSMPTALISSSDEVAITMFDSFKKKGVIVPSDISIIGVGNSLCTMCTKNCITSIEISTEQTIMTLVKLFLRDIVQKSEFPKTEYVVPQSMLVVRGSTAPPRTNKNQEI